MSIENTSTPASREVTALLALATGEVGSIIESEERAGQAQLVNSTQLPTRLQSPREDFEAVGFTFGAPTSGDPMFMEGTLPQGWKREASDHAMWSHIVDEHGRRRASIFYKAAFYDRRADMHIDRLPRTRAQAEAWSTDWADSSAWMSGDDRREGLNYVYCWKGRDDRYQDTGRRLEIEVAPDGSVVERRES